MTTDPRATRTVGNGMSITRVQTIHVQGTELSVVVPIAGLPELFTAVEQERAAAAMRGAVRQGLERRGKNLHQPNDALVFDLRQAAGTAVTAIKTGLEAYVNWHAHRIESKHPGTLDLVKEIWRPLTDRLRDLPGLLTVDGATIASRPTQQPWWPKILVAFALADLVRHGVEAPAEIKGLKGQRTLLERLCDGEGHGCASAMLEAFDYYTPLYVQPTVRDLLNS